MAGRERLLGIAFAICVGVATGVYAFQEPLRQGADELSSPSSSIQRGCWKNNSGSDAKTPSSGETSASQPSDPKAAEVAQPGEGLKTESNSQDKVVYGPIGKAGK